MLSEAQAVRVSWLRSQGLGIVCGQATALLLGVGSFVLVATRDGASAGVEMDDVRAFFTEPSAAHVWFYLLVPVLALYGVNTLLCTWDDFFAKWRAGLRAPRHHAAALLHVGFLVALGAHLLGGLTGREDGVVRLGSSWQSLGDGRDARLVDLRLEPLPTGALEQAWATVEVRAPDGTSAREVVSYNAPLSRGLGSDLFLLVRQGSAPEPFVLMRHRHAPGNALAAASAVLMAVGLALMWRRFV